MEDGYLLDVRVVCALPRSVCMDKKAEFVHTYVRVHFGDAFIASKRGPFVYAVDGVMHYSK